MALLLPMNSTICVLDKNMYEVLVDPGLKLLSHRSSLIICHAKLF